MGGAHDDFVDHHCRHGSPGDGIHGHRIRVAGMPHHHPLVDLDAAVARAERVEFFFGDADQQNRLMVFEHIGIEDHPRRIENDLDVDRLAGIGGNVHHIQALEHIAQDLAGSRQFANLEGPIGLGDRVGLVQYVVDALLLDVTVVPGLGQAREQQQENEQPKGPEAG
ncbi:hypothetical protein D3C78_1287890 [compost metagenome]